MKIHEYQGKKILKNFNIPIQDGYILSNLSDAEKEKCGFPNLNFTIRTALIKDFTNYSLGAHTDTTTKFVTFLFYLSPYPTNQACGSPCGFCAVPVFPAIVNPVILGLARFPVP